MNAPTTIRRARTAEPTLAELAHAALAADEAERAFLFSDDPANDWQGPGDRRDIDLWDAKIAARDAFLAKLNADTGIDAALLAKVGELL